MTFYPLNLRISAFREVSLDKEQIIIGFSFLSKAICWDVITLVNCN